MTYSEIVKQALAHLEYGTDDDSFGTFFERFMIYANDAVRIIAEDLKMDAVEEYTLDENSCFQIDKHALITKIIEVYTEDDKGRKRLYPFVRGSEMGDIRVLGRKPETNVLVRFRFVPSNVTDGNAEPDIPAIFHPLIYLYIVHCHHNSRSTSSDYDRTKWLQMFNQQRRRLIKQAYGSLDTYAWKNRPWETGEM